MRPTENDHGVHFTRPIEDAFSGPVLVALAVVTTALLVNLLAIQGTGSYRPAFACLMAVLALSPIAECTAMLVARPRSLHGRLLAASNGLVGVFLLAAAIVLNRGHATDFSGNWIEAGLYLGGIALWYKMGTQVVSTIKNSRRRAIG